MTKNVFQKVFGPSCSQIGLSKQTKKLCQPNVLGCALTVSAKEMVSFRPIGDSLAAPPDTDRPLDKLRNSIPPAPPLADTRRPFLIF